MTRHEIMVLLYFMLFLMAPLANAFQTRPSFKFKSQLLMTVDNFDAIFFDCDGVIAETERDVHRVTFNQAFKEAGIDCDWDVELYGKLLEIGGGKERMTEHFNTVGWPSSIAEADRVETVKALHKSKTAKFQALVESGIVPPRPGVIRLIDEAFENGIKVAICSTSNEAAVATIARVLLGDERCKKIPIYAGEMVSKKKPAPDVYLLAAKELNIEPARTWVIEDSGIGLAAAKAAGMRCTVTKSVYTEKEDFSAADVIVKDLEQGLDGPITVRYLDYKASRNAFQTKKSIDNAEMFAARDKSVEMFTKIAKGDMGKKGGFPF